MMVILFDEKGDVVFVAVKVVQPPVFAFEILSWLKL